MKTNFNLLKISLIITFCLLYTAEVSAQEPRVVTLYVDTANINTNTPDNELGAVCNFGQEAGVTNEAFLIEVNQGDIVQWRGQASGEGDIVNIEQILYVRGPNPFPEGRRELPGTGENGKTVTVQATNPTGENTCKYMVKFTVIRDGSSLNRTFNIDPEIRVR